MDSLEAFCEPVVLFGMRTQHEGIEACVQFKFALPINTFIAIDPRIDDR